MQTAKYVFLLKVEKLIRLPIERGAGVWTLVEKGADSARVVHNKRTRRGRVLAFDFIAAWAGQLSQRYGDHYVSLKQAYRPSSRLG